MKQHRPDYIKHGSRAWTIFHRLVNNHDWLFETLDTTPVTWHEIEFLEGVLSGFPECCAEFFAFEWSPFLGREGPGPNKISNERLQEAADRWPYARSDVGYITCPPCGERIAHEREVRLLQPTA